MNKHAHRKVVLAPDRITRMNRRVTAAMAGGPGYHRVNPAKLNI
jgi:hypothetical protein